MEIRLRSHITSLRVSVSVFTAIFVLIVKEFVVADLGVGGEGDLVVEHGKPDDVRVSG